ncbi:uncharacterized protein LOC124207159 [Daphnia pulex]|uniref:uncharacterized protein LOC124207159 n=1 Tax=Daphnia pulex TaxID=6669 RepID=UPI001EDF7E13|nr:uncharacterized protein LOC124207159 [Daphnia pulex]XP_046460439.1 uncharacterized protein LOC124207159 [Daphnia pulex]
MSRPILLSLCVLLAILTLTSAVPANRRERDVEIDKLFAEMFPSSATTQAPVEIGLLLGQMETEFQNPGFNGDLDKYNNFGPAGFLRIGPVYSGGPFKRWFY